MQVHEIGFGEAMTESFYSAAVARKGGWRSLERLFRQPGAKQAAP
jgi:hypothetical protein